MILPPPRLKRLAAIAAGVAILATSGGVPAQQQRDPWDPELPNLNCEIVANPKTRQTYIDRYIEDYLAAGMADLKARSEAHKKALKARMLKGYKVESIEQLSPEQKKDFDTRWAAINNNPDRKTTEQDIKKHLERAAEARRHLVESAIDKFAEKTCGISVGPR
jgi:hypothetical protein